MVTSVIIGIKKVTQNCNSNRPWCKKDISSYFCDWNIILYELLKKLYDNKHKWYEIGHKYFTIDSYSIIFYNSKMNETIILQQMTHQNMKCNLLQENSIQNCGLNALFSITFYRK